MELKDGLTMRDELVAAGYMLPRDELGPDHFEMTNEGVQTLLGLLVMLELCTPVSAEHMLVRASIAETRAFVRGVAERRP